MKIQGYRNYERINEDLKRKKGGTGERRDDYLIGLSFAFIGIFELIITCRQLI
jgi:hypothetical protein